jgi:hypothetical protein
MKENWYDASNPSINNHTLRAGVPRLALSNPFKKNPQAEQNKRTVAIDSDSGFGPSFVQKMS